MSTIQDADLLSRLNAGLKQATPEHTNKLGQDDFFQLMTAQLKNQDPTKPVDGQAQLAQLAQFSAVDGIQQLQKSFDQLAQSLQSLGALQASSLVGHSVMIDGDSAYVGDGKPLQGSVNVTDSSVNDLTLILSDGTGREIRRLNLGNHTAGSVDFTWDGLDNSGAQVAPGNYHLRAEGTVGGKTQSYGTQVMAAVQSVSLGQQGQGMTLNLAGLGGRSISDVREIL